MIRPAFAVVPVMMLCLRKASRTGTIAGDTVRALSLSRSSPSSRRGGIAESGLALVRSYAVSMAKESIPCPRSSSVSQQMKLVSMVFLGDAEWIACTASISLSSATRPGGSRRSVSMSSDIDEGVYSYEETFP